MTFADAIRAECANYGPDERRYIEVANDRYTEYGKIEVDSDAVLSCSTDGCYVQAWVWVSNKDAGFDHCPCRGKDTSDTREEGS